MTERPRREKRAQHSSHLVHCERKGAFCRQADTAGPSGCMIIFVQMSARMVQVYNCANVAAMIVYRNAPTPMFSWIIRHPSLLEFIHPLQKSGPSCLPDPAIESHSRPRFGGSIPTSGKTRYVLGGVTRISSAPSISFPSPRKKYRWSLAAGSVRRGSREFCSRSRSRPLKGRGRVRSCAERTGSN